MNGWIEDCSANCDSKGPLKTSHQFRWFKRKWGTVMEVASLWVGKICWSVSHYCRDELMTVHLLLQNTRPLLHCENSLSQYFLPPTLFKGILYKSASGSLCTFPVFSPGLCDWTVGGQRSSLISVHGADWPSKQLAELWAALMSRVS